MIELYHYKNSICSERARMALHEKQVTDYVSHHVDLFAGEQFAPEYRKLSPKAQTPILVHGDVVIHESSIICDYIDDAYSEPALKPADPIEVAQMREWIKKSDDQLYEAVACLSFVSVFRQALNDKGDEAKERHFRSQTDLARVMRQRSCVEQGFGSEYVVRSVFNALRLSRELNDSLQKTGPWLMGDQYTLAEIDYSPFLARLEALQMLDVFFAGMDHASRWWEACKSRDCYIAAEVGPAPGAEADRYATCGKAARAELEALVARIQSTAIYDLVNLSDSAV